MTINGIDVSHWEPNIVWREVKDSGVRFVFAKASQANFSDKKFNEHWAGAKAVGLPRGAYHFYDPYTHPKVQAERFVATLNGDYGELPLVLDIEGYTSGQYHGSENWYIFLEHLKTLVPDRSIIIYTAYYYWNENVRKAPAVKDVNYFDQYDLWVANYDVLTPLVPEPWHPDWVFWQYSDTGVVPGVYDELGRLTKCDLNYFYGNEQQFQDYLKGFPTQPPQPPNGGNVFYKAIGNITIRTGPGTTYPQVSTGERYVLVNDIVETDLDPQNGFVHIVNIYREDVKMTVANPAYCGTGYLQATTYTPPTLPAEEDDLKIYVNDVLQIHMKGKLQSS